MAKFFKEIRVYPGRWMGVCVRYDPSFIEWLKTAIPLKAWDKPSGTWWMPESFEPIVSAELVRRSLLTAETSRAFTKEFYAHQKLGTSEEPYAILNIRPGSPRGLVDLAYQFWKRHYAAAGGTGTSLEEVEAAYAAIVAEQQPGAL